MSQHILIIDNDPLLCSLLSKHLEAEGFLSTAVHDGQSGLKKALNQNFTAIIMDILLPKLNGFEVLKALREHTDLPVLLFSSRNDDIDRIIGLEIGADDYLSKPANPHELISRLKAILRRSQKAPVQKSLIKHHHITVDCAKRQVLIAGTELELTNAEFNILEILIKSPGQAFSKEELTEYALGRKYTAYDRSIDVHISNLRNKMGENAEGEAIIKTVRGFGYSFNT
jgi:two-component system response regulator CpxR